MNKEKKESLGFSLTVKDGNKALEFYREAFEAEELYRNSTPDGGVGHAELMIGNTKLYLSDEFPEWKAFAMPEGHLSPCLLCLEVEDCDAAHERALKAGAKSITEPKDEFWGMRSSIVADPFGFRWAFGQVIEDLTPDEVTKRAQEADWG